MFSFDEYEYDRVFKQEQQGIIIFNQLGRGFVGQTVQPGTKKVRQGPKRYHGGGRGQCRD